MPIITGNQILEAANPANRVETARVLAGMEMPVEEIFRGMEMFSGEIPAGNQDTAKYARTHKKRSFVTQQNTLGVNSLSTRPVQGGVKELTLGRIPWSQVDGIKAGQQPSAFRYVGGRRLAMTPQDMVQESYATQYESSSVSFALIKWYLLKHGKVPHGQEWAKVIEAGTGIVPTWNDYDFLQLWSVARPAGAEYAANGLVEGFDDVNFSVEGAVEEFITRAKWTMRQKRLESKSVISMQSGAFVVLGRVAWDSFINSPDLKKYANYMNPQFQNIVKMDLIGTEVAKVEINGVIFMSKDYTCDLDFQGQDLTFLLMEDLEILVLPKTNEPIVDLIRFNTTSIEATNETWTLESPEYVWSDTDKAKTSIELGMRGEVSWGNAAPEMAVLGSHVAVWG